MSFKDKLTSFLFRNKAEETSEEEALQTEREHIEETPQGPEIRPPEDPSALELPADHPIRQLYDLRRSESGYLPPPRLYMDEEGILPPETVAKEKNRLQSALKSVCGSRMKMAKGRTRGKHNKKKNEAEAEEEPLVMDARPWIFLSSDKLYAWMLAFPPIGQGEELSRKMVQLALAEHNVTFGIDKKLVDRVSREQEKYFNLYLIAKGKPAFDGRNGNIVDYVPRVVERVLEVDEFGQVDYTHLNLICNVKEGQEICRLIRPTEGEPGRTVLDQEIPAKSGKSVPLPKGRNTEISEDGDALLAMIPGHVEFTGHNFQVKPVLDIDGDVDFSTGNIKFVGDVNIKGDVLSGFSVRAMGNIQVGGVVEAGSTVEAGGDLTVVKGILGDGSTVIRSSRCIFSKYIENATIYVRENLQTDCIVNGHVYCDGEVIVRSGRGSIIGGRIWAAKKVSASTIGAKSEVRTAIALGGLPCTNFERALVRKEYRELSQELERLEALLDSPVKSSLLGKVRMKLSVSELKLKQLEEELAKGSEGDEKEGSGRMECGIAFAGTEITIGTEKLRLRQESRQCIAKLLCGEIVLM
ncbi:FapA family protein [Oscillospiraceae bacterium 38-13]